MLDELVSDALKDFAQVATLAHATIPLDQVRVEILGKPHKAKDLPLGKMAVYSFFLNKRALKVGKVGPKGGPRFTYQHYTGSALSTL
jgi:site-specific recombinase XerC